MVMLPLRVQNSSQTCRLEGFLVFGKFASFTTPSLGWVAVPKSFVSLFIFYILSYLLLKRMGCLSRCLVFTSIQKLFCGSCWAFKWSFDEFVGEKVVSPSFSSTILRCPPPCCPFKGSVSTIMLCLQKINYLRQLPVWYRQRTLCLHIGLCFDSSSVYIITL